MIHNKNCTCEHCRIRQAAPELLKALKELYANWREYTDLPNDWADMNEQIEAIIAKCSPLPDESTE
ncbi:hypothetical protein KAR91_27365 [Candidatus Pacearchaeota archaeon]|nr:hypothetical protein [Candidatus Pacearchaeota archaeon]